MIGFLVDVMVVMIGLQVIDRDLGEITSHVLIAVGVGVANFVMMMGIGEAWGFWLLPAMVAVDALLVYWWAKLSFSRALFVANLAIGAKVGLSYLIS